MDARFKLLAWLKAQSMSQAELARKLGVARAAITLWVKGRAIPVHDLVLSIARLTEGAVPPESWPEKCARKVTRKPAEVLQARRYANQMIASAEKSGATRIEISVVDLKILLNPKLKWE